MTLKRGAKFEVKLTLGCKNGMKNLMDFNVSSDKSEKFHFDVLRLSKLHNVSAIKVQRSHFS